MTDILQEVALAILRGKYPTAMPPDLKRWPSAVRDARAAIEAMREPSDAMLAAGDLPGWDDSVTVGLAGEVWRAMVDAALTPSTPVRDVDVTVKTVLPEDAGSVR